MMEHRVETFPVDEPGFNLKATLDAHEEEGWEIVAILTVMGQTSRLATTPPRPCFMVVSRCPKLAAEDVIGLPSLTEANAQLEGNDQP